MSHHPQKKRRSIVVEGVTYTWKVYPDFVGVWHPTMGMRRYSCSAAVTPRYIAEFIYAVFLHKPCPPRQRRPLVATKQPVKIMAPRPSTSQPEAYVLQREDHTFPYLEDHGVWRHYMIVTLIAGFHDPALAKMQAQQFNPSNADELFAYADAWQDDPDRYQGFTLYRAVALPMFETVTTVG